MMRWLKGNLSTDICNNHIQTCHQQPPNERYQPRALASENLGGGGGGGGGDQTKGGGRGGGGGGGGGGGAGGSSS